MTIINTNYERDSAMYVCLLEKKRRSEQGRKITEGDKRKDGRMEGYLSHNDLEEYCQHVVSK